MSTGELLSTGNTHDNVLEGPETRGSSMAETVREVSELSSDVTAISGMPSILSKEDHQETVCRVLNTACEVVRGKFFRLGMSITKDRHEIGLSAVLRKHAPPMLELMERIDAANVGKKNKISPIPPIPLGDVEKTYREVLGV